MKPRHRGTLASGLLLATALILATGARPTAAATIRRSVFIRQLPVSADLAPTYPAASAAINAADPLTNTVFLPLVHNGNSPEAEVVVLTNQERAKAGCPALTASLQLAGAAEGHSADMAINDYFSHYGLDGRSPWDRIQETGYTYSLAAENIAAGYSTPAAVVQGWMNSHGHRANILNCSLTEIGVGYVYLANDTGSVNYHHYWTQLFATPKE